LRIEYDDIHAHCGRTESEIEDLRKRVADQRKIDAKIRTSLGR
jgi:hypothetical protein